jgi:hypothetical protein
VQPTANHEAPRIAPRPPHGLLGPTIPNGRLDWDGVFSIALALILPNSIRPMAFREGNYAAVAAMNASPSRKVGPALVVSGEDPRFEGKFNGHTHMGMLGSTALAQFDVFLDWAEKNIPNPIVKTSCTKRPARGP